MTNIVFKRVWNCDGFQTPYPVDFWFVLMLILLVQMSPRMKRFFHYPIIQMPVAY